MKVFLALMFVFCFSLLPAQPILNSRQKIEGLLIYRDFKDPLQFYYGPGDISLALSENGKPEFQLTQMRYTGTACGSDQGDKRFLNLLQFGLRMEKIDVSNLTRVKASLAKKYSRQKIKLAALPVRFLQTYILLPVESNGQYQKAAAEGVSTDDKVPSGTFWGKKDFSFRLTNAESQLLWRQVEENHLSVSVGYGFYVEGVLGDEGEMSLSGTRKDVEELIEAEDWEELLRADSTVLPRLFHAGTLTFDLDVSRYPGMLKKLDINEGLPPDYPALEIRCYDFRDELRPDLALKRIEIAGVGINGKPLSPKAIQFNKRNPQQYIQNFRFPFAVRMEENMQYRITSFSLKGERNVGGWISRPICEGLIDLTTSADENPLEKMDVAFEIGEIVTDSSNYVGLELLLAYEYGEKKHVQPLSMSLEGGNSYRELSFVKQKGTAVVFLPIWIREDGTRVREEIRQLEDDYYFLQPPS